MLVRARAPPSSPSPVSSRLALRSAALHAQSSVPSAGRSVHLLPGRPSPTTRCVLRPLSNTANPPKPSPSLKDLEARAKALLDRMGQAQSTPAPSAPPASKSADDDSPLLSPASAAFRQAIRGLEKDAGSGSKRPSPDGKPSEPRKLDPKEIDEFVAKWNKWDNAMQAEEDKARAWAKAENWDINAQFLMPIFREVDKRSTEDQLMKDTFMVWLTKATPDRQELVRTLKSRELREAAAARFRALVEGDKIDEATWNSLVAEARKTRAAMAEAQLQRLQYPELGDKPHPFVPPWRAAEAQQERKLAALKQRRLREEQALGQTGDEDPADLLPDEEFEANRARYYKTAAAAPAAQPPGQQARGQGQGQGQGQGHGQGQGQQGQQGVARRSANPELEAKLTELRGMLQQLAKDVDPKAAASAPPAAAPPRSGSAASKQEKQKDKDDGPGILEVKDRVYALMKARGVDPAAPSARDRERLEQAQKLKELRALHGAQTKQQPGSGAAAGRGDEAADKQEAERLLRAVAQRVRDERAEAESKQQKQKEERRRAWELAMAVKAASASTDPPKPTATTAAAPPTRTPGWWLFGRPASAPAPAPAAGGGGAASTAAPRAPSFPDSDTDDSPPPSPRGK